MSLLRSCSRLSHNKKISRRASGLLLSSSETAVVSILHAIGRISTHRDIAAQPTVLRCTQQSGAASISYALKSDVLKPAGAAERASPLPEEAAAKLGPDHGDRGDEAEQHDDQRLGLAIFEQMEGGHDFEAEAASAHHPHRGGDPQIVLPAIEIFEQFRDKALERKPVHGKGG